MQFLNLINGTTGKSLIFTSFPIAAILIQPIFKLAEKLADFVLWRFGLLEKKTIFCKFQRVLCSNNY